MQQLLVLCSHFQLILYFVKYFSVTNPIYDPEKTAATIGLKRVNRVLLEISLISGRLNKSLFYLEEALLPAGLVQVGPQVLVRPYCLENMSSCFDLA